MYTNMITFISRENQHFKKCLNYIIHKSQIPPAGPLHPSVIINLIEQLSVDHRFLRVPPEAPSSQR